MSTLSEVKLEPKIKAQGPKQSITATGAAVAEAIPKITLLPNPATPACMLV
jgi:hypothetical protein